MHIIGHRGARGEAPENTLGGFNYLKQIQIHAVEFDVRQLTDQHLVVIHDDNLKRTAGQNAPIETWHIDDLIHHDHRVAWTDWQSPEPTPELKDVLNIIANFSHIEVEIKAVASADAANQLVTSLLPQLSALHDAVVITSFDTQILHALNQQQATFKKGLLIESEPDQAIELAQALNCQQIGWMDALATAERIKRTHDVGLQTSVWTVNDIARAEALYQLGIHGLITDFPLHMKQHFNGRIHNS